MDLAIVAAAALERAIDAGVRLGLDVTRARAVARGIAERGGFPGDLYVLALAGGTGVGKSSLLNALAGTTVSEAGVRRPTTAEPVAWVPGDRLADVRPLLDWLGGAAIRERPASPAGPAGRGSTGEPLAVLDLPDLDSIEPAHAARVDAVLPRVDAVLWVSDTEKYQDAVLHDVYLRRWAHRLARQAMAINKVDRLADADAERVRRDLADRLAAEGLPPIPILLTSALTEPAALRAWLADGVEAKAVVSGRLVAEARAAIADLARDGGIDPGRELTPLLPAARRDAAVATASREVLAVLDLPGLERQAVAATRLAARPRGGGPVGMVRSLVERGSGVPERRADPEGHLRRWRDRGSLERAVQPIRELLAETLPTLPPAARPGLAPMADASPLSERFAAAADRAVIGRAGSFRAPTSRAWSVIGLGQLAATAAFIAAVVWLVALFAAGGQVETPTVGVPILGPIPTPAMLLLLGLAGWFVLGRVLAWHAARLGRRWAQELAAAVTREVDAVVGEAATRPLAEYEGGRRDLWAAARERP